MAVRSVTEGVDQWNSFMPFPKDRYACHCVEEEFKFSSGDNPMLVRTWEIVKPEIVKIGDKQISVAGLKVTQYLVTKNRKVDENGKPTKDWDTEKSDQSFGKLRTDLQRLGFDGTEIDDEKPPLFAKGKTADLIVYGKEDKKCKSPSPEQLAKGIKRGDPITDNEGKEIIAYQLQIDGGVYGLSDVKIDSAF